MVKKTPSFPPDIDYKLTGWDLFWAELTINGDVAGLEDEQASLVDRIKRILRGLPISEHPVCQSVRGLFRNAGCDPTIHRPSSEALIRRLMKGVALPAITPAVDINNIWSVEMLVPCCVLDPGKISGPIVLRKGQPGEMMASLRGPFNLEGKPVLVDEDGPFGTPITDSDRVKVKADSGTFWMVAYLPKVAVKRELADECLKKITGNLKGVKVNTSA